MRTSERWVWGGCYKIADLGLAAAAMGFGAQSWGSGISAEFGLR